MKIEMRMESLWVLVLKLLKLDRTSWLPKPILRENRICEAAADQMLKSRSFSQSGVMK